VIIPGGNHNDGRTEKAYGAMVEFLDSLTAAGSGR
jgi:hypothetical protein